MWRFIAGVCEAKITASRRVAFVLLGIMSLWGLAGSAYAQQVPSRSFAPGTCQGTTNNPDNPYCLTSLDTFSPGSWGRTRYGVLLDKEKASDTQILNAGKLTETSDDLFISCTENPTQNSIIPVTSSQWNSVSQTVNIPLSSCTDYVGATSYLFRKLHFNNWLVDFSAKTAAMGTGPEYTAPVLSSDTKKLIIVIHGWNPDEYNNKFVDQPWDDLIGNVRSAIKNSDWKLSLYHWEKDSATGGVISGGAQHAGTEAAEIGHQHGQNLGDLLKNYPNLEKVQFIAHSAGSWVARSAVKSLLLSHTNIKVQVTLLDPYIPGEALGISSLTPSNLTLAAMNAIPNGINYFSNASANSLYLLEDIFSYDQAKGIVTGTDTWLGWRDTDKTLRIEGLNPLNFLHPYNSHAGPVQFYADTISSVGGLIDVFSNSNLYWSKLYTTPSDYLGSFTSTLLSNYGWKQSMFYQEPIIIYGPSDQPNQFIGDTITLRSWITARGNIFSTENLHLRWQEKLAGSTEFTDIPNATGSSYTLPSLTLAHHCRQYQVIVKSIVNTRSAGEDVSNPATVTIAGQGACQVGGGAVVVTPTIQSVSPLSLNTQSSGTQPLTILGTGFTSTSTVNFTFDSGTGPINITALSQPRFISWNELKYDIAVGTTPGTWTVAVANGGLVSQPKVFNVVSPSVVTTAPAAPIGLNSFSGNWTKLTQFTLDWTNPTSAAGISKVWWKIGAAPTSATDGSVASINSAKPLQITLPVVEGQQDVYVWLEDGAGNRSHLNRSTIRLGKDVTPPVILVTSQLTASTTQSSVTLSGTFSDALSGVSRVTWSNNYASSGDVSITPGLSGSWTTQPITLYGGDNYIAVAAIDAAGNYTTSAVTIRKTDTTNSGSIMFTLSPPEAVTAGAKWRANGGVWHLSGEYELNVPAGVAQVDFQGANNYVAPQGYSVIVTAGQVTQRTESFPYTVVNVPPYSPSSPYPANGTAGLSRVNPSFSWTGGGPVGGVDYHFMLGNTSAPETNPLCEFGFGAVSGSSVTCVQTLNASTTYYWKVAARDETGAITNSPVWSFTTEYAMPDLIVSNVVLNGNVAPGANVTTDVTVQNIGNFPTYGTSYVHVYLSTIPGGKNFRLTPNVPNNVPVLQPGQTQTFNIPVTLTDLQSGTSYLDAWIDSTQAGQVEGNIDNNLRSIPISYLDGQAPSISSAGLQNTFVKTGVANSIYYTATDDTGIRTVDFYYSVDDGANWLPIEEGVVPATPTAYGTTYSWAIPANLPIVSNLKIRVVARDASGNAGEFIAGPYVVHDGTVPTVAVVSPNGGEILSMGSTQQIQWSLTSANAITGIGLYFYHDVTAEYIGGVSGTGNGTFSWTLPNNFSTTTGKIRINIQDINGNTAEDYSDGFFTIRDTSAPPPAPWAIPQALVPGGSPQLATDSAGNLHMAYRVSSDTGVSPRIITQTIMYTKRSGATWSSPQTVYSLTQQTDSNLTGYYDLVDLRLAVSNAGTPYMVWGTSYGSGITGRNQNDIFFTSFNGSNWSAPFNLSVDLPGFVGVATQSGSPRIQVDSANAVHIVWTDGSYWNSDFTMTGQQSIYYRKMTAAGVWEPAINASGISGSYPDLSIDSGNTLHLAFLGYVSNSSAVLHVSNNGTGWTSPTVVANGVDSNVRIASDSNNHLHVVWRYYNAPVSKSEIYYSYFDGVTWSPKELVSSTTNLWQTTISIDSLNRPHVTWEDWGYPYKLFYIFKNGNQWATPIQLHYDSQVVVNYSSAATLSIPSNEMHVAWVSTVNGAGTILYNHANVGSTTDSFQPSVSVTAPVAGTTLSIGSSYDILWNANDNVGVTTVDLHYSADNGATWTLIAASQPNSGTYSWVVPASASLQVRVTARDAAGSAGTGFSGTVTTSDATPPTIALTALTSGTSLVGNSSANVNWTAADNVDVIRIDLDYSLDSGVTWLTMASALSNSGSYAWLVPNSPTSTLLIRAIAHDAVGYTTVGSMSQPLTIVRANTPPLAPSMPFPLAAGVNVPVLSTKLNWTGGDPDGDALTYQILFGTTANPPVIATVSNNAFAAGTLQYSTQYYWQVVASDGNATTVSPVWTFTTENDVTAPTGTISINSGAASTNSTTATLTLSCTDAGSGCAQMQFSNDNSTWSTAETYTTSKTWTLATSDGTKTVYAKFKDSAGNWSTAYGGTITLDTTAPTTTASPAGGTYNSTQSVTLTCNDGTGSGCDKIYYTTDGTTPSTLYSGPISISTTTTLKFFAKDLAGNSEAVNTATYTIDATAPLFNSTSLASNSYINTASVGYSLSAALLSGKITFTRTGGSADSATHIYNFTDSDKTTGTHSVNTGLNLVNGAIYTVTFEATDLDGNGATPVSITNITYDTSSASVTINSPASGSVTNNVNVGYTLSEDVSAGDIVFTRTGGSSDGMSPYAYTLGASERTAGSHTVDTGKVLMDGTIYTVSFENIKDIAGNQTASISTTNVTYDSTSVSITSTTPAANSIITTAAVGYALSETASSGKVTFTWTGGKADRSSHIYTITSPDLTPGSHTVTTGLPLADGAFYTVTFEATDLIGNPATTVSNAMVYYESAYDPGSAAEGNVDNSGASASRVDGFDLIKLSLAFGSRSGDANWNPACDLDGNGVIEGNDLIVLGSHFGEAQ